MKKTSKNHKKAKSNKYYVQNGDYREVLMSGNMEAAVERFMDFIVEHFDEPNLSPLILVSQEGYMDDCLALNIDIDSFFLFRTSEVLENMGMDELADHMKEMESNMDETSKSLYALFEECKDG